MTTTHAASPDKPSSIEQALFALLFLAGVLMLSLPGARSISAGLGWTPLWLLSLPSASLAIAFALRRLRRDVAVQPSAVPAARRRRTMAVAVVRLRTAERGAARRPRLVATRG